MALRGPQGERDMDRAARLLSMQEWGVPLDAEDMLWLEAWKDIMQEADSMDYGPTTMWSPRKKKDKGGD